MVPRSGAPRSDVAVDTVEPRASRPASSHVGAARPAPGAGPREWAAVTLLRRVVRGLREGWDLLPPEARRRYWVTLGAGLLVSVAVSLGLTALVRAAAERGALDWEPAFVSAFAERAPFSFNIAVWMDAVGNTLVLWTLVLVGAGAWALRRETLPALSLLMGQTMNFVVTGASWLLWARDRPELVEGGVASPEGLFHSHPSGHLVQAAFVYGLLAWFWVRASTRRSEAALAVVLALVAMALVAAARLRLGAHWPTDLVSAAVVAWVWLGAVVLAIRRGEAAAYLGGGADGDAAETRLRR